jgi:nucleotide-binding universal stress UspA family protein
MSFSIDNNKRIGRVFSNVLVAIDGSEPSLDAAAHAIIISERYNVKELHALHIIYADVGLFASTERPKHILQMKKDGEEYLNRVKLKAKEKNIQEKTEIIASFNIASGIVDAENKNVDLIVVGTRAQK